MKVSNVTIVHPHLGTLHSLATNRSYPPSREAYRTGKWCKSTAGASSISRDLVSAGESPQVLDTSPIPRSHVRVAAEMASVC